MDSMTVQLGSQPPVRAGLMKVTATPARDLRPHFESLVGFAARNFAFAISTCVLNNGASTRRASNDFGPPATVGAPLRVA